jgi:hypothetical protein
LLHTKQKLAPLKEEYCPAAQLRHALAPDEDQVPAGQLTHIDLPVLIS